MLQAAPRRIALNALIAAFVFILALDTLPQAPPALQQSIQPLLLRLGINQGPWNLFAPEPDKTNTRLRAEIVYRDGESRTWNSIDWTRASAWQKWVGHRHFEWQDHIVSHHNARIFEPWCRMIAR